MNETIVCRDCGLPYDVVTGKPVRIVPVEKDVREKSSWSCITCRRVRREKDVRDAG